uniref:Glutaminase n=1 Tax=Podospora anserina (strain S / ATCC MYA-4624 / DSM 980 / FGSC 10383) TaxID=515849 RepID=A0A090CEH8_PODAN|nr:Putative Glutaminase [Podospora anserina S mat+]
MRLFDLFLLAAGGLTSASTLTPNTVPLIVRNPYLSTWLYHARDAPWENWPMFWTGAHVGFSVMASASGKVYPLLGRPQDSLSTKRHKIAYPEYLGVTFDASTTNLSYSIPAAGGESSVLVTLSFLSPITPSSTMRQAIPAGYMTVFVAGCDDLDLYTDVNGEWVTGNRDNTLRWEMFESPPGEEKGTKNGTKTGIKTWKVRREREELLTEFGDRAEWGTLHFSAPGGENGVRYQSGTSALLRGLFAERGELRDEVDGEFRRVMEDEPVFAFSKGFKLADGGKGKEKCEKREESVRFTWALVQDPVVQFASARGLTMMRPLWQSFFTDADELVGWHFDDFETAAKLAGEYSDALARDAYESGSREYQDIAALSARQVLGATQFSGTPEDPILFLKEISSNGNFQTVDVIFPAFPFFLYTNPRWLAYLLEPLLEHQLSGQYPNDYSMHDLGAHFPNATGHPDGRDEYMPVEECGNMLIMGLALANALRYDTDPAFVRPKGAEGMRTAPGAKRWWESVDEYGIDLPRGEAKLGSTPKAAEKWLSRSYKLWKQWTGYLVRESLIPHNQLCTDDFAGWLANQTNLALKGIIGIKAMSEIADIVGEKEDAKFYRETAGEYIEKWQEYGISRDGTHAKLAYTWYGSWTTIYNLYADSLLCFHVSDKNKSSVTGGRKSGKQPRMESQIPLGQQAYRSEKDGNVFIPDKVYQMQSDWYHAVLQKYGLPLDSRHLYTKSDWEFFAAAVTGRKTRTEILTSVARWVNETETDRPFTDLYDTEGNGGFPGIWFMARPVVGGHFAFLALERACGGKAVEALKFLDKREPGEVDVELVLMRDLSTGEQYDDEGWEDL